ncbi:hypothetical protein RND81_10G004800 [Saponaria officinalis]|uniref:dolichyl-diphosphooligosaccharide--protein glycotransferase n=1 Tax=Saponaria officinalis TaxID=3572 RepID=A0AAW1HZ52_SAPOF
MAATESAINNGSSLRHASGNVLAVFILILIGVLSFSIRLFSVIKYESVIHEFDPYFNYRVTQVSTGPSNWWNGVSWINSHRRHTTVVIEFFEHSFDRGNCLCVYCTNIFGFCFMGNLSSNKAMTMKLWLYLL